MDCPIITGVCQKTDDEYLPMGAVLTKPSILRIAGSKNAPGEIEEPHIFTAIEKCVDDYLVYLKSVRRYSDLTIEAYQNDLSQLQGVLKIRWVWQFNREKINQYQTFLNQSFKISTVTRKLACLKKFLDFCSGEGLVKHNLTQHILFPRESTMLPKPVGRDVLGQLLDGFEWHNERELRDLLMIELLYSAGLRASELAGLAWAQLDLSGHTITVLNAKNGNQRLAPLGMRAVQLLTRWSIVCRSPWVFPSQKREGHITRQSVYQIVRGMFERFSSELKVHPHQLRHSFATHLLQGGADIRVIQEMLGHKNLNSTQWYTKLDTRHLREVYDRAHPRAGAAKKIIELEPLKRENCIQSEVQA